MKTQGLETILFIGGGPSNIGHETELDAAVYHVIESLAKQNITAKLIDNNAYSLAASEMDARDVFCYKVNVENVTRVIQETTPDAIVPVFGGFRAIRICKQLLSEGILKRYQVKLLGISEEATQIVGNPLRLSQLAHEIKVPIIPSEIVRSEDEAFQVTRKIGLPVIVKPVLPRVKSGHIECKNMDTLSQVFNTEMVNSRVNRCVIEKSIVGDKELSMTGVRDEHGTKVLINGIEDIDAVGIHSGDSIAVSPMQTINDSEYQLFRNALFNVIENLDIKGFCEVSFSLDTENGQYFMTKISPYYTRGMALAEIATGYPVNQVFTNSLLGRSLSDAVLSSNYHKLTAIMEPTIDRVMIRMPVWPFQDIPGLDTRLKQNMKSVGSAVGVGRTVEEAILKALRSSQFNPRDTLPTLEDLSDDRLISQLIHPQANRIQVLIEALRRNYQIEDLSELTKIDSFYFAKLKHLLAAEKFIINNPLTSDAVRIAHENGFGDGMISSTWKVPIEVIDKLVAKIHNYPTYKMMDPSAGEVMYELNTFYSSYEVENEAEPLSADSVLVVGRGGNHLGPNTAAEYYTAEILLQIKTLGFNTIILNNNPNSASLTSQVSDRRYIEPIQLGNILDIIKLEQPKILIIPGNRHFLFRELKRQLDIPVVVLPADQETGAQLPEKIDFTLNFFVTLHHTIFIAGVNEKSFDKALDHVETLSTNLNLPQSDLKHLISEAQREINNSEWKGLVEVLCYQDASGYHLGGIRPVRITETIFLNRITRINWIHRLVSLYVNRLDIDELKDEIAQQSKSLKKRDALLTAVYPYQKLGLKHYQPNSNYEVGAKIEFRDKD